MKPLNWATVVTEAGGESTPNEQLDKRLEERIQTLKSKWEHRNPDKEVSVITGDGELIYLGRYNEGVVITINGDKDSVTFLTPDMARQFGVFLSE